MIMIEHTPYHLILNWTGIGPHNHTNTNLWIFVNHRFTHSYVHIKVLFHLLYRILVCRLEIRRDYRALHDFVLHVDLNV